MGRGDKLTIALIGDSGIDGHHTNNIKFGPYTSIITDLSRRYSIEVHVFAVQGSKSGEVIRNQLPEIKQLKKVDLICVYMGANNIIRGYGVTAARDDYLTVLECAEQKGARVIASEVADYYLLKMFSYAHRLLIYIANKSINKKLRQIATSHPNFVLIPIEGLTKKYFTAEHQADGLHPNDKGLRLWGDVLLEEAKNRPALKPYF